MCVCVCVCVSVCVCVCVCECVQVWLSVQAKNKAVNYLQFIPRCDDHTSQWCCGMCVRMRDGWFVLQSTTM